MVIFHSYVSLPEGNYKIPPAATENSTHPSTATRQAGHGREISKNVFILKSRLRGNIRILHIKHGLKDDFI
jgi:hypothetical protein